MIQVKFFKWYPFLKDENLWDIEWDTIQEYDSDEDWLEVVNNILQLGYFVGIHREPNGMIAVAVDITWFRQR